MRAGGWGGSSGGARYDRDVLIEPTPGLDAEQQAVHDRLAALVGDPDRADPQYAAIPETRNGKIVSVDSARYLLPEFRDRDFRLRHTPSTATPAGAYANGLMRRKLAMGPREGGDVVRFMAGGAGSGKTSSLGDAAVAELGLVFDNPMHRADRGRELLVLAAENGWKTQVVYVHRPFELVVRGVIARSVRTGRWNRLADLPTIHTQAQETFWSLATDPTLAADFVVLENLATTENPVAVRLFGSAVLGPREPRR